MDEAENSPEIGLLGEELDEAKPRAAALALSDLDLVGERADDRDAEPALGQLLAVAGRLAKLEAAAGVADLDREPVALQLVDDVDAAETFAVGVLDRVRAGLGQRELEVVERLVGERTHAR